MQSNPFVEALKIAAFAVLAFLVWLAFWQSTHIENQLAATREKESALTDKVAEMSRKVDDLKSQGDRLQGAADAISKATADALARGPAVAPAGTPTASPIAARAAPSSASGIPDTDFDKDLDPSRPVGTPGRYRNFLSRDPEPPYPPEAAKFTDGDEGEPYASGDPKGFNVITESHASLKDLVYEYVKDGPANRHWGDPSKWAPALCWRIEASPDSKEWTLFFRKDAVWHAPLVDLSKYRHLAGTHRVTAKDYKFTLDMLTNTQHEGADLRSYYEKYDSVRLIDDFTAVVRWKETVWESIAYTMVEDTGLVPEFLYAYGEDGQRFPDASIGLEFNNHFYNQVGAIGCGPYRFAAYERGQRMVLERFEDWYGVREGIRYPIRRKRIYLGTDPDMPNLKLKAGEMDLIGLRSTLYKKEVLENTDPKSPYKDGRIHVELQPRPRYAFIGWANRHPLFKDKRVRKALALACNREDMCKKIYLDAFAPMASPVYPGSREADPDLKPLPFDLKAAAALLDEVGWKVNPATGLREMEIDGATKKFDFVLSWPSPSPEYEAMLNQYKNDLLTIGIRMDPKGYEWGVFQKKVHDREFEAMTMLWVGNGWEHDFNQIWHSRQIQEARSSNMIEYSNPELDTLSDDLQHEMDVSKRAAKVRRIGRILFEDQPYLFFGWNQVYVASWAHLKNVSNHLYKIRPFMRTLPMWVER